MKKINKELAYSMLIKLCVITIIACTILKWCGYKDFEIPLFSSIVVPQTIRRIVNYCFYCLNGVCFTYVLVKRKLKFKEILIVIGFCTPLFIISLFDNLVVLKFILEFVAFPIIGFILSKDKLYRQIIESTLILLIFGVYQVGTMLYKDINIKIHPVDFISYFVLDIDYYYLIILTILHNIKKGGYIYGRWFTKLVILSKRRCVKESIQQNQNNVQEIEFGFKLFIVLLSITQFFVVGVACYFINGVIFEYIAIFISFVMMRKVFGKSYHSDSIIKCTTLAMVVFVTATRLSLPLWLSALCNVMIGCLIAYIMYIMYYYIKFTNTAGITVYKGMKKEDLNSLCDLYQVEEIDRIILTEYYVNRKRLDNIAFKVNYSVDNVKKRKAKVLKVFQESIK